MMLRGEIYECPQCNLMIQVLHESQCSPMQLAPPRCACGELLVMLQSGSESIDDVPVNKIAAAELKHPAHEHAHHGT
jgi:hypothetical protein